jgi:hypothetical protein
MFVHFQENVSTLSTIILATITHMYMSDMCSFFTKLTQLQCASSSWQSADWTTACNETCTIRCTYWHVSRHSCTDMLQNDYSYTDIPVHVTKDVAVTLASAPNHLIFCRVWDGIIIVVVPLLFLQVVHICHIVTYTQTYFSSMHLGPQDSNFNYFLTIILVGVCSWGDGQEGQITRRVTRRSWSVLNAQNMATHHSWARHPGAWWRTRVCSCSLGCRPPLPLHSAAYQHPPAHRHGLPS